MNGELLSVLEHLERDKGIERAVLIKAIENALVSAARKTIGKKHTNEVTVKMDTKTGSIKILSGDEEINSDSFGRIAAQTAKQVIIQKIREAERDVIFNEFKEKIGTIITGAVHRFDKGNIIVDLGKVEAILPKKEQVYGEKYKQGDRIRAYLVDVEKTPSGPKLLVSRSHAGLVKKLFELEVPEIYENIVEIKSISREAGDRTKLAVYSKDAKIDSVGACVGMRGARVKNIVRDLHGEKIDIVRWSEDLETYVKGALSPAEIQSVKLVKNGKKVEVIVDDDQLSLAIGKHGQNVRLACKLIGMDMDIRSISSVNENKKVTKEDILKKVAALKETKAADIANLEGVGPTTKKILEENGFSTIQSIASASIEQITALKGIGTKTAEKILKSAKNKISNKK